MNQEVTEALEFRESPRGQYILAQALYLAIQALDLYPEPMKEVSNSLDMQYMLDTLHHGMGGLLAETQPSLIPPYGVEHKVDSWG